MYRFISFGVLLGAIIIFHSGPVQAASQQVAVVEFQTENIDPTDIPIIEGLLDPITSYIGMLGYNVVTSDKLGKQESQKVVQQYRLCKKLSCYAAIGKTLGAPQILTFAIARAAEGYTVSMTLLDTTTEEPISRFLRLPDSLDKLRKTLELGVLVVFGWEKDETGVGVLSVKTDPPGALITVDGREAGKSPLNIRSVPVGERVVTVQLNGRVQEQTVLIEDASVFKLSMTIDVPTPKQVPKANRPTLRIESKPAGALIYLDGVVRGLAPLTIDPIGPGEHEIEFELSKYQAHSKIVEVSEDADGPLTPLMVSLAPQPAQILLTGTPDLTTATIKGDDTNVTTVDSCDWFAGLCAAQLSLPPGKHHIILKSPLYYDKQLVFTAGPGAELEFEVEMSELPLVRLFFPEDEPPEDLKILVDGKPVDFVWDSNFLGFKTDAILPLEHGAYDLRVSGTGIKPYRERLIIHELYSPSPEVSLEASQN